MRKVLFAVLIFFCLSVSASAVDTLWTRVYGGIDLDAAKCVQQTQDGGFILTGLTDTYGQGIRSMWLIKTDANGDTLWTRVFGTDSMDVGNYVIEDSEGNFVVTGYIGAYVTSKANVWLLKVNSDGDSLWSQAYGDDVLDERGFWLQETKDSGYVVAGCRATIFESFNSVVLLLKTDSDGNLQWLETYNPDSTMFGWALGHSVDQTADSGFIIAGYFQDENTVNQDVYLIKTDSNGDSLWARTYGGGDEESGWSVEETSDSGFIVTGYTDYNLLLLKTDSDGDSLWARTYGGETGGWGFQAHQTTDSGYIICGWYYGNGGDAWLLKTDEYGDTIWTRTYGGTQYEALNAVQQTSDGGYVACGWNESESAGYLDYYLLRMGSGEQPVVCGDANGDTEVTVSDAVYLVNYLFKNGDPPECPPFPYIPCADANGDDETTISDVVYLINYIFKSGPDPIC